MKTCTFLGGLTFSCYCDEFLLMILPDFLHRVNYLVYAFANLASLPLASVVTEQPSCQKVINCLVRLVQLKVKKKKWQKLIEFDNGHNKVFLRSYSLVGKDNLQVSYH